MMDVYVDVLFLLNTGMDALCLLLVAELLHIPTATWRWLLAAALGGCYAVLALWLAVGELWAMAMDVLMCLVMCLVAFGRKREWRRLPLQGCFLMGISMLLGGMMTGIYQLLKRSGISGYLKSDDESESGSLTSVAFVLLAVVGGVLTHLFGKFFARKQSIQDGVLTITYNGVEISLTGMIDSGNLLTDPLGGEMVILVRGSAVGGLFSERFLAYDPTSNVNTDAGCALWDIPEASRLRLIPTTTVTGSGMLVAVRVDEILWTPHGKAGYRVNALIALGDLTGAPVDALLPSGVI